MAEIIFWNYFDFGNKWVKWLAIIYESSKHWENEVSTCVCMYVLPYALVDMHL